MSRRRSWTATLPGRPGLDAAAVPSRALAGPLLLKGILPAADAVCAARAGVGGVIVSNHGGRQVDGAIGALHALPAVASAVGGGLAVLFDSGVRTGADTAARVSLIGMFSVGMVRRRER